MGLRSHDELAHRLFIFFRSQWRQAVDDEQHSPVVGTQLEDLRVSRASCQELF